MSSRNQCPIWDVEIAEVPRRIPDSGRYTLQLLVLGSVFAEAVVKQTFFFADSPFCSPSTGLESTISLLLQNIKVLERWSQPFRLAEKGGIDKQKMSSVPTVGDTKSAVWQLHAALCKLYVMAYNS